MAHSQNVQQCVSVLLDKGVPVDCQDTQGRTPLHLAVQLSSEYICTIMCKDHRVCTSNTVRGRQTKTFSGDHYQVYAQSIGKGSS